MPHMQAQGRRTAAVRRKRALVRPTPSTTAQSLGIRTPVQANPATDDGKLPPAPQKPRAVTAV